MKTISDPKLQKEAHIIINNKFINNIKKRHNSNGGPSYLSRKPIKISSEVIVIEQITMKLTENVGLITKTERGMHLSQGRYGR